MELFPVSGRTVGPRIELRKEFCDETDGQKFHMYTTAGFLEYYRKKSQTAIDKNVINEVDSVDAEKFYEDVYKNYTGSMMLRHIEEELDEVNRLIYEREHKRQIECERSMKQKYYSYAKKLWDNHAEE